MEEFGYEIIRSTRKTVSISIKDYRVIVRAPLRMNDKNIEKFVFSKKDWVIKHLDRLKSSKFFSDEKFSKEEIDQMKKEAKKTFSEKVGYYAEILHVDYNKITVRYEKTKWGSCTSNGNLNFNALAVLFSEDEINYLVVHELCHLKEMNHSERFWNLVKSVIPDYKIPRKSIKENGNALISRLP